MIGIYTCHCDTTNRGLLDVGDACVDKRYYKPVRHENSQGQKVEHKYKAVHYAPQKGNFSQAMDYCESKRGKVPDNMDREVQTLINVEPNRLEKIFLERKRHR